MRKAAPALLALSSLGLLTLGVGQLAQADDPAQLSPPAQQAEQQAEAPTDCVAPAESFGGKTIKQWRAAGPEGLAELMEQMKPQIQQYRSELFGFNPKKLPDVAQKHAEVEADIRLLDAVAQQRDAYAAGLYWYTDLEAAQAEARRTGKPILSLRLLGKLHDEYSCANSRFFRTVLYADQSIGDLLRDKYVLHWQSVRPVPVITIEMGDGRTIKRTITGNSAHYVLDTRGRVIDCMPGLYGPDIFEKLLRESHAMAGWTADADEGKFVEGMKVWHQAKAQELDRVWVSLVPAKESVVKQVANERPTAREAGRITPGKFAAEAPMIAAISTRPSPKDTIGDDKLWQKVAAHYAEGSRLDATSRELMRRKTIPAEQAFTRVIGKTRVEDPMLRMVRNFEGSVALDTALNEHLMHRQLHDWFAQADAPLDLDTLNRRVYAELFLTPEEDPWLGLVPADTYSALDGGGLIR